MTIKYKTHDGEIHTVEGRPFVCLDRKGQDVYEGDHIKGTVDTVLEHTVDVHGVMRYDVDEYIWMMRIPDKDVSIAIYQIEDIELIPDAATPQEDDIVATLLDIAKPIKVMTEFVPDEVQP